MARNLVLTLGERVTVIVNGQDLDFALSGFGTFINTVLFNSITCYFPSVTAWAMYC